MPKKNLPKELDEIVNIAIDKIPVQESITINGVTINFNLKLYLTIPERSAFIDSVIAGCFVDDEFYPEYADAFKDVAFWRVFTDLPIPTKKSDKSDGEEILDLQRLYDWCYATDILFEMFKKHDSLYDLYADLEKQLDNRLDYVKNYVLSFGRHELSKATAQLEGLIEIFDETNKDFDFQEVNSLLKEVSRLEGRIIGQNVTENPTLKLIDS